jgi:hypothetical protein
VFTDEPDRVRVVWLFSLVAGSQPADEISTITDIGI